MNDVEKIALWVGLISSIVSIVLSIVATTFAVLVNYRSEKVSDQTIKSLQKIEADVERLSEDTAGLIKAGWETMLGTVSRRIQPEVTVSSAAASEIASGLASEVRSNIGLSQDQAGKQVDANFAQLSQRIDTALEKLRETVEAQLKSQGRQNRAGAVFRKVGVLRGLSPAALELAFQIKTTHLTRKQYKELEKGLLSSAVRELREQGLLVPLTGLDGQTEVPVYWFPPNQSKVVRSALLLTERAPSDIGNQVLAELNRVKYIPETDA